MIKRLFEVIVMYKYETHLHTYPVSKCANATPRECVEFYKKLGYDGIFITNHFLDGNINVDSNLPYEEKIEFYFSDYEAAKSLEKEVGIKVFFGVELSYNGTDFLVYGLHKKWFLSHPEIMDMKKSEELALMAESGALIIQAHPFRAAEYIDHIRLYPNRVHGVEVINACRKAEENEMAKIYAKHYSLLEFAGSDNHIAGRKTTLAGMCGKEPVPDEDAFVEAVKAGKMETFTLNLEE